MIMLYKSSTLHGSVKYKTVTFLDIIPGLKLKEISFYYINLYHFSGMKKV